MLQAVHTRRTTVALVVMIALVAIMIPTVAMIGCEMSMGKGMPYMPSGVGIFKACTGSWVVSSGPAGVVPTGLATWLLVFAAMILAVAVFSARQESMSVVVVECNDPPPPPEDPLGQRFRI